MNRNGLLRTHAKLVILSLISVMTVIASCRKGEEPAPDKDASLVEKVKIREYIPEDPAYAGTMVAIKYLDFDNTGLNVTGVSGRAWAKFPGLNEYMSAGEVSVLGNKMDESAEHLYSYNSEGLLPGIDFSLGISSWNISGSLTVPSSNFIIPGGFPEMTGIVNLKDTLDREIGFSFGSNGAILYADSVRFTVFSSSSYVYANKESGEQYHTFNPGLLKHLTPGEGLIMMTAFRFITISSSGSEWAVLHQTSSFKDIHIK
jgi:hypothetical protein